MLILSLGFTCAAYAAWCQGDSLITVCVPMHYAAYLETAVPICEKRNIEKPRFIGYIEDLLFAPELNYLNVPDDNVESRLVHC